MKSSYITNSGVNSVSGGGIVSINIIKALKSCTLLDYIFSCEKFQNSQFEGTPAYAIDSKNWGYNDSDPFFMDYMAYHMLPKEQIDLAVTYACPFGLTAEELKREFNSKIVCDLAPHNIDISREEHEKYIGSYPYPHLTGHYLWGLYSRHLRYADRVIVHSHKSAEYIEKKAKLKETPTVIPHGTYIPETTPSFPEKTTPSYLGASGFDKGIIYMVNSWLRTPHPTDLQMIIGGREAQFKLEEQYMSHFKFTGYIEKLKDFFKQVSFGIFPSVTEGFNICALDYMAYGRPVIVAEGAGMSELITDGKDGFVVPIRDVNALQTKIQYFNENPGEAKRMGNNAQMTAKKYKWSIIRDQYKKVFEELL